MEEKQPENVEKEESRPVIAFDTSKWQGSRPVLKFSNTCGRQSIDARVNALFRGCLTERAREKMATLISSLPEPPKEVQVVLVVSQVEVKFHEGGKLPLDKEIPLATSGYRAYKKERWPTPCQYFQLEEGCSRTQWECKFLHACDVCGLIDHGSTAGKCKKGPLNKKRKT